MRRVWAMAISSSFWLGVSLVDCWIIASACTCPRMAASILPGSTASSALAMEGVSLSQPSSWGRPSMPNETVSLMPLAMDLSTGARSRPGVSTPLFSSRMESSTRVAVLLIRDSGSLRLSCTSRRSVTASSRARLSTASWPWPAFSLARMSRFSSLAGVMPGVASRLW